MRRLTVNKEGMSRLPKRMQQQVKRVAPPAVPETYRHSGSSFSSAGYGSCDDTSAIFAASARNTTNSTNNTSASLDQTDQINRTTMQSNSSAANSAGSSSNSTQSQQSFIYHVQNQHQQPLTHKAAVYYHQQLALQEDQGIDLTQSPGRDSPGSSSGSAGSGSRHSTVSLDSGRASSYHTGTSSSSATSKRIISGGGIGCNITLDTIGGGILNSPRCSSVSSCSIGSADNMSQRSDHEIITDWLRELCFDEYAPLFSEAGYDMPTISRMTPEDLTAIGIKKPRHRERIKQHIDALQLPDNLPHYVPGSIEEWLRLLRLEEYVQQLLAQGYRTVRDVTQLPWEDMEDIGIVKLGHQKKLLLAIKRIKDILSGKWIAPGIANSPQDCLGHPQLMMNWDHQQHTQQYYEQLHLMNAGPAHMTQMTADKCYQQMNYHQGHPLMTHSNIIEKDNNDIVLIKLRQPRGRSLESLEDTDEKRMHSPSHLTFSHHGDASENMDDNLHESGVAQTTGHFQLANNLHHNRQQPWRQFQYADGDITPTNEMCSRNPALSCDIDRDSTSLLRHRGMTVPQRAKPIAMVKGNVMHPPPPPPPETSVDIEKGLNDVYGINCNRPRSKNAPEPPRRLSSDNAGKHTNSIDQICDTYDSLTLSGQPAKQQFTEQDIYNSYNQMHSMQFYENSDCQMMTMHQQQQQQQQPIYANYNVVVNALQSKQPNMHLSSNHIQTKAEVHAEKPHFSTNNDSKSNSSIDSIDALPFANDNAGTIKQRANQYHQMPHANSNINSIDAIESSSKLSSMPLPLNQSAIKNASADSKLDDVNTIRIWDPPRMSVGSADGGDDDVRNSSCDLNHSTQALADGLDATVDGRESNNTTIDSNVLNDIGNMLANLTDELDAMLEEEKRVGLNDSE